MLLVLLLLCAVWWPKASESHGRLVEPPSRSSMWRFGFQTEPNYNDNELFCGGYTVHWQRHGGKCGVCGDPWHVPQPRPNEAGGKYGKGIIVRRYSSGQGMTTTVELTANHQGFFEFKLCPNNNPKKVVQQECLDRYPLSVEGTSESKYYVPDIKPRRFEVRLTLPQGVVCSQCVFQWTYTAGNNWGQCENGTSKVGCGPQETFRGCADIAIDGANDQETNPSSVKPVAGISIRPGGGFINPTVHTTTSIFSYKPTSEPPVKSTFMWSTRPTNKPMKPSYKPTPKTTFKLNSPRPTLKPSVSYSPTTKSSFLKTTSQFSKTTSKLTFKPKIKSPTWKPSFTPTFTTTLKQSPPETTLKPTWKPYTSTTSRPSITKIPPKKMTAEHPDQDNHVDDKTEDRKCKGVGVWKRLPGIDGWCDVNCARGFCPSTHCQCT